MDKLKAFAKSVKDGGFSKEYAYDMLGSFVYLDRATNTKFQDIDVVLEEVYG